MEVKVEYLKTIKKKTIDCISSKSYLHRLLICAAVSDKDTFIEYRGDSLDIVATINCLRSLGSEIEYDGEMIHVRPLKDINYKKVDIFCNESGSTFRFMLGLASCFQSEFYFTGAGRLPQRPVTDLVNTLRDNGIEIDNDSLPMTVKGGYKYRDHFFSMPGNISSQYVTALLLSSPLIGRNVEIKVYKPIESQSYIDMSTDIMKKFGVEVDIQDEDEFKLYRIDENQRYISPGNIKSEGDWSNAAFLLAAGVLSDGITIKNLSSDSKQGDRKILDVLKNSGATVIEEENSISVFPEVKNCISYSLKDTPDMLPVLSIIASKTEGISTFRDGQRLRLKESDRLISVMEMVNSLGGRAYIENENLIVDSSTSLRGGKVSSFNDHRIVMAASVAAVISENPIIIEGAEAVRKSYPDFFTDLEKLGFSVTICR